MTSIHTHAHDHAVQAADSASLGSGEDAAVNTAQNDNGHEDSRDQGTEELPVGLLLLDFGSYFGYSGCGWSYTKTF